MVFFHPIALYHFHVTQIKRSAGQLAMAAVAYHNLYTPLEQSELQSEINSCHHQLMEWLGKPEHKLLLKMVDDYDHFVDVQPMDTSAG